MFRTLSITLLLAVAVTTVPAQDLGEPEETSSNETVGEIPQGLAMANAAFQAMRSRQFYQAQQLYDEAAKSDKKYENLSLFCTYLMEREQKLAQEQMDRLPQEVIQASMSGGGFDFGSMGGGGGMGGMGGGMGGFGGGMGGGMGYGGGMGGMGGGMGGYGGGMGGGMAMDGGMGDQQFTIYDLTREQFEQILELQMEQSLDGADPLARERVVDLGLEVTGPKGDELTVGEYLGWARPKSANGRIYDRMRRRMVLRQRSYALREWLEQKRQEQIRKREELRQSITDTQGGSMGGGFGGGRARIVILSQHNQQPAGPYGDSPARAGSLSGEVL